MTERFLTGIGSLPSLSFCKNWINSRNCISLPFGLNNAQIVAASSGLRVSLRSTSFLQNLSNVHGISPVKCDQRFLLLSARSSTIFFRLKTRDSILDMTLKMFTLHFTLALFVNRIGRDIFLCSSLRPDVGKNTADIVTDVCTHRELPVKRCFAETVSGKKVLYNIDELRPLLASCDHPVCVCTGEELTMSIHEYTQDFQTFG